MMGRLAGFGRRLRRNERGVAMIEFAYALPIVVVLGMVGLEMINYAIVSMRVSQMASNLADTTSRVGENTPLAVKQIRESDINDSLQAVRLQGETMDIAQRGRIILSSLERNATGGQWIRWQRCLGLRHYASSYGVQNDGATGTALPGMGPTGEEVQAPANSAVMFVEIAYQYEPLISDTILGSPIIRSHSAFLVRDRRDLTAGSDPVAQTGVTASTCNLYTS